MSTINTVTEQLTRYRAGPSSTTALPSSTPRCQGHSYTARAVAHRAPHDPCECGLRFQRSHGLSPAGRARWHHRHAARRHSVVADVEMICSGLSVPRLAHFGMVTTSSSRTRTWCCWPRQQDTTRAVQAMRKAHRLGLLKAPSWALAMRPTALIELARLIAEEGVRPALVVGMPVGFVSATESKDLIASQNEVPLDRDPRPQGRLHAGGGRTPACAGGVAPEGAGAAAKVATAPLAQRVCRREGTAMMEKPFAVAPAPASPPGLLCRRRCGCRAGPGAWRCA